MLNHARPWNVFRSENVYVPLRVVHRRLGDLGTKINQQLQPVFTSKKIADHLKVTEEKPPLINQQSVVYEFSCDLCDTNYTGYTCRHLHQRVEGIFMTLQIETSFKSANFLIMFILPTMERSLWDHIFNVFFKDPNLYKKFFFSDTSRSYVKCTPSG